MSETFMTLTECIPGWVHSHIIQDRISGLRYAVCQRCRKTLYFKNDHANMQTGWMIYEFKIQEWP